MSKIAVVTDSNSGITQAQAKACGVTALPMPFYINEVILFYKKVFILWKLMYNIQFGVMFYIIH
mgnify:CR=1 FL=1